MSKSTIIILQMIACIQAGTYGKPNYPPGYEITDEEPPTVEQIYTRTIVRPVSYSFISANLGPKNEEAQESRHENQSGLPGFLQRSAVLPGNLVGLHEEEKPEANELKIFNPKLPITSPIHRQHFSNDDRERNNIQKYRKKPPYLHENIQVPENSIRPPPSATSISAGEYKDQQKYRVTDNEQDDPIVKESETQSTRKDLEYERHESTTSHNRYVKPESEEEEEEIAENEDIQEEDDEEILENEEIVDEDEEPAGSEENYKQQLKKKGGGGKKKESSGGSEYEEHHEGHKGEKGEKTYKKDSKHEKAENGHHDKERHKGEYEEEKGSEKKHHNGEDFYGEEHKAEKGKKGKKFGEGKKHKKGHSTHGVHNIVKKDEYIKKTKFYDEDHDGGEVEHHGEHHLEQAHKKGGKKKGGHHKKGYHKEGHGKKGHHDKGHHNEKHSGFAHDGGKESHYGHEEDYANKKGKKSSKKWKKS